MMTWAPQVLTLQIHKVLVVWEPRQSYCQLLHKKVKQNVQIQPKLLTIPRARLGGKILHDEKVPIPASSLLHPDFNTPNFTSGRKEATRHVVPIAKCDKTAVSWPR
jgi:hypothetical protein